MSSIDLLIITFSECVLSIDLIMSSVVTTLRSDVKASSIASFTTPSISAPLYPSVLLTIFDKSILAKSVGRLFSR